MEEHRTDESAKAEDSNAIQCVVDVVRNDAPLDEERARWCGCEVVRDGKLYKKDGRIEADERPVDIWSLFWPVQVIEWEQLLAASK